MITITLDGGQTPKELDALAALIAVLGGRVGPTVRALHDELHGGRTVQAARPLPLTPGERVAAGFGMEIVPTAQDDEPTSEQLLKEEANRAADRPTGSTGAQQQADRPERSLDSRGIPWDERIHGRSTDGSFPANTDGTWRKRRGVSDETVRAIEAELLGKEQPPVAPVDTAPPAPDVTPAAEVAPPPPPVTTEQAPPPPPPAAAPATGSAKFANVGEFVMYVTATGLPYVTINAKATMLGKTKFSDVTQDPTAWDDFVALLDEPAA